MPFIQGLTSKGLAAFRLCQTFLLRMLRRSFGVVRLSELILPDFSLLMILLLLLAMPPHPKRRMMQGQPGRARLALHHSSNFMSHPPLVVPHPG
jgi:hypothetical protein